MNAIGGFCMPASVAHFVNMVETYHTIKSGNGDILESQPVKPNELIRSSKLEGKSDKGISEYAFLGSVFPDLPYYNPPATTFAADFFHYNLSGTFAIKLIDYAKGKGIGDAAANNLMAFTLGFISHIACDIICHPYINTIAGSYWSQPIQYIDKIDVPLLPIRAGKVSMHMITETHQDSWLASNYFGLPDLSSTGALKSWSDFINDLSLGILVPTRKAEMKALFKDICNCFNEVYGRKLDEDGLWTAGNRIFESLDGSYDRALFPFPDKPSINLVNYQYRGHDYWDYLKRTFVLSQTLCNKAIDYYRGGDQAKTELKKYLKNWNLDMGYCFYLRAEKNGDKIESIHIVCEHSWCHDYGLSHTT